MIISFLWSYQTGKYVEEMVRTAKAVHRCPIVQMTDLVTPRVIGVDEVIRHKADVPLMTFRLRHLARFPHKEMLVLDSDVISKAACPEVWAQEFDVALAKRDQDSMAYNTGVMFSRGTEFWRECLGFLLSNCKPKHQNWYGDQLAVEWIAPRYRVLDLPCDVYNWTPEHEGETSAAKFYHFKGAHRKLWITCGQGSTKNTSL